MKHTIENLTPLAHAAHNRCFGCGEANATGLQLRFFLAEDGTVVCPATIPDRFEGHPGYLHGGIIATLLDEIMSKVMRSRGVLSMTRHMEVDYLRPVPSNAPLRLEGRMTHHEGRKRWAEAKILNGEGKVLATGKGLFVEVQPRGEANPAQP
ncbi:MAG TPA: PaaI family thioesterase [Terracidiphilus sp.]|nr:PaaI family thioesterase [Terracidiphilus sp.]